jgi:hypothetical protein
MTGSRRYRPSAFAYRLQASASLTAPGKRVRVNWLTTPTWSVGDCRRKDGKSFQRKKKGREVTLPALTLAVGLVTLAAGGVGPNW